ncbi:hypothetical protein DUNSADRAFT_13260 [Dunaliella salina]|uniref:Encoded protein n=1 Tax=Dunaliella salina TaxID=3046 RepID=A0ABQ7G9S0_DUNSA|nr:hypothetical protein DUNSADRAFT_13260 [Dunaliella salina]|eukprot:KAF5831353.1 hypothetical protein DUNSADRAFT_13260 [Dunaliella salina]
MIHCSIRSFCCILGVEKRANQRKWAHQCRACKLTDGPFYLLHFSLHFSNAASRAYRQCAVIRGQHHIHITNLGANQLTVKPCSSRTHDLSRQSIRTGCSFTVFTAPQRCSFLGTPALGKQM